MSYPIIKYPKKIENAMKGIFDLPTIPDKPDRPKAYESTYKSLYLIGVSFFYFLS